MNKPIFNREDFTLCDVPVPKGYPQSQTHSGIAMHDGNYYLTTSPYPERKYSRWQFYPRYLLRRLTCGRIFPDGEFYENPCLYVGEINAEGHIPSLFRAVSPFPLTDTPKRKYGKPAYNSDPDIFIDGNDLYILNRAVYRKKETGQYLTELFLMKGAFTSSGLTCGQFELVKDWDSDCCVSPCLTKYNDQYLFMYLDSRSANDSETFNGLYIQEMNEINDLKGNHLCRKVEVKCNDYLPWHMSLFPHKNDLYAIIACVRRGDKSRHIWQMLGRFSNDLSCLTIFSTPLTDYNSYRGAACVRNDGTFILYTTTVFEYVAGSTAVDGRNVIVAHKPFDSILSVVSSKEYKLS